MKKQFDDPNSNDVDCVDFALANRPKTPMKNCLNSPSMTSKYLPNDETVHQFRVEQKLQQQLIKQVQALSGNDRCADCSTNKEVPTWLSTNLGVLVCIECSGIHRDLGVHISRIQSLTLDHITTSQLMIAHNMGNDFFNEVYEAKLQSTKGPVNDSAQVNGSCDMMKLEADSTMEQRCDYIRKKYLHKTFCQVMHQDNIERRKSLECAVVNKDLKLLVQLLGEGFDLASCIQEETQETSIHLALKCQKASRDDASIQFECDLYILDFIIQNSRAIDKQNLSAETPLHYAAKFNLPECMKLLLKSGADVGAVNSGGETPMDVVKSLNSDEQIQT